MQCADLCGGGCCCSSRVCRALPRVCRALTWIYSLWLQSWHMQRRLYMGGARRLSCRKHEALSTQGLA